MKSTITFSTLCIFLFCVFSINAQIIVTAESLEFDKVSEAFTKIKNSTETEAILYLPGGEATWGSYVNEEDKEIGYGILFINNNTDLEKRKKSIKIIGTGVGDQKTTIKRNNDVSEYLIDIICNNSTVEIHNIDFIGNQNSTTNKPASCSSSILQKGIQLRSGCKNLKISNCKFSDFGNSAVSIVDKFTNNSTDFVSTGVIYKNEFKNNFVEGCTSYGYAISLRGNGKKESLSEDPSNELGENNTNTIFIEENTFTGNKHAITSNDNSTYVFRYNEVKHNIISRNFSMTDAHGPNATSVGSKSFEIYNNKYYDYEGSYNNNTLTELKDGSENAFAPIVIRGGDGVIFNNKTVGSYNYLIKVQAEVLVNGAPVIDTSGCDSVNLDSITTNALYAWDNISITGIESIASGTQVGFDGNCGTEAFNGKVKVEELVDYKPYTYPHPLRGKVNLALNKPTLAQANSEGYSPGNAVNGQTSDTSIRWQGNNAHFWQVDLGNEYNLSEIKLVPYYNGERYYNYEIYGSETSTYTEGNWSVNGWTKIIDQSRNTTTPGTEDGITHTNNSSINNTNTSFLNSPNKVRYLRVKMTNNSTGDGAHLVEFEAYGTPSFENVNLAFNKNAFTTREDGVITSTEGAVDYVVDGDTSDPGKHWAGNETQWWKVDLENNYDISRIKIVPYYGDSSRYYDYTIQASSDGINWSDIITEKGNDPETVDGNTHDVNTTNAQHLRVQMTNNVSNAAHLVEFEAYGTPSSTTSNKALNTTETLYSDVLVYPNPTTSNENTINLNLGSNELNNVEIKVSNSLGQTSYSNTFSNPDSIISLDTKQFSEGLNFIHIKSENFTLVKKIIISKN